MAWHDDAELRLAVGSKPEARFPVEVRCHCGGEFQFIGHSYPGCPDFTCGECGQLVDVKNSPQSTQTGNLAVSTTPWLDYPEDLLLVTHYLGSWIGAYKKQITPLNSEPLQPTHASRPTSFFLICLDPAIFRDLVDLGYRIVNAEAPC